MAFHTDAGPEVLPADTVLVALGRTPAMAVWRLGCGGGRHWRAIVVYTSNLDERTAHLRRRDVNGGPQFTYVSLDDHRIVLDQLTGTGARSTTDRRPTPLFLTPPLSRVGLTERAAAVPDVPSDFALDAGRRRATAGRYRAARTDRPRGVRGHDEAVVDAETDEILGAALLSYDSHEVINTVALRMRHGITASQLRDEIYTHPSMTEAFNELLGALH